MLKIKEKNHKTKNLIKLIIGAILIVLGIIGLFLPIIPGALLILAGLFVLGISFHKIIKTIKSKKI